MLSYPKSLGPILLLLFFAGMTCSPDGVKPPANDQRPNLIFLLADDLRYDALGYTGHPIVKTPAIDSLAAQSTRFERAYVTTSICSVSRASFLTGQYARRHAKWGFGPGFGADEWFKTYEYHLDTAGYRTGFIGKYGVGEYDYASQQFDYWRGFPGQGNFNATDPEGQPIHLTRLMGEQMQEFLQSNPDSVPFALSVSFKAPHVNTESDTWQAFDPAFADLYEGAEFPQAVSGEVEHFDHFNEAFLQNNQNEARQRYLQRFGDPETGQNSLEGYYRLVHGIDRAVSRLVQTLEAQGRLDNTIIIFASDNGLYLGEYGFSGKWYGSEPSIRIPMFVYDPAAPPQSSDALVLNIDVAKTLLDYAQIAPPDVMQGRSLTGLVYDSLQTDWREDFLYEHLWNAPAYPIPSTEGVVNDSAKYMRYFMGFPPAPILQEELYLLNSDPDEIRNLAGQADLEDVLEDRLEVLILESQ